MDKAFQSLREFFKHHEIEPFAENMDPNEFSLQTLAMMSVNQLQENFMWTEEIAIQVYQSLEQVRNIKKEPKKKTNKRLSNLFQNILPSNSTTPKPITLPKPAPKRTFINEFEDLSDIIYKDGDDWQMDLCSAAYADSYQFFQENYEPIKEEQSINNEHGWTPLMYACALNCEEIIEIILSNNPNLCIQNKKEQTALMIAASFGHTSVIQQLIKYSKEKATETSKFEEIIGLQLVDDGKSTALHYAVFYAQHDTVSLLLEIGADPNAPDIVGMTPTLMACVEEIQAKSLSELIKKGGNLYHCNHDGKNGYDIAQHENVPLFKSYELLPPRYGSF